MDQPLAVSYFLSKNGSKTRRIAGPPGKGHLELAREELTRLHVPLAPETDLYQSMFQHGYARVMQDGNTIYIDAPKSLSRAQRDFAIEQEKQGNKIMLNSREFVEMRAAQVVPKLVG